MPTAISRYRLGAIGVFLLCVAGSATLLFTMVPHTPITISEAIVRETEKRRVLWTACVTVGLQVVLIRERHARAVREGLLDATCLFAELAIIVHYRAFFVVHFALVVCFFVGTLVGAVMDAWAISFVTKRASGVDVLACLIGFTTMLLTPFVQLEEPRPDRRIPFVVGEMILALGFLVQCLRRL